MNRHKVCAAAGALAGAALLAGACAGTASAMASGNGGNRTGVIQGSGAAHAKKGAGLAENRIGIGSDNGGGWVKENGLGASWGWGSTWGKQIAPSGDRTGVVQGNGFVKEGRLSVSWGWESAWGR